MTLSEWLCYLQFIYKNYTYTTVTTTTTKLVDQFSRVNDSTYDDTLRATRMCIHDDYYNVQTNSATLLIWSRLKTSCTKLINRTEL